MCIPIESNVSFRTSQVCIFFFSMSTAIHTNTTIWVHFEYSSGSNCWDCLDGKLIHDKCIKLFRSMVVFESCTQVFVLEGFNFYMMFCSCWYYLLLYLCSVMWYWQIVDGDIICYQKRCLQDSMDRYRYPSVPSFFEYIHNRQVIYIAGLTEYA
jgi:hypothetical protein